MRKIANWLEAYSESETLDILSDFADHLLSRDALRSDEDCARLRSLVRKGKWAQVCAFEVPHDPRRIDAVKSMRQAQALFSKLEFLDIGIDKRQAAVATFFEAEAHCRETNELLVAVRSGRASLRKPTAAILYMASQIVAKLLGPCPSIQQLGLRFGPGATSLTKKREASIKRKLGDGISCSEDLIQWAPALLCEMPHLASLNADQFTLSEDETGCWEEFWGVVPVRLHTGAISFVRKNASTDRTTETQPNLNGMLQLGIGDYMSPRLSRTKGLDLYDQTLNRALARIGSLTGEVATLDLKSASNYIARELVRDVTPVDWYQLLSAARVRRTKVPGHGIVDLEMFSGMGNGFTFPLQSVIFYSLARATAMWLNARDPIISVYGDDIIVDSHMAGMLMGVLSDLGLMVNLKKSYLVGPFRESCGADFLAGTDVRPVYVKETLTPALLFSLHNGLFRRGDEDAASWVRSFVHPDLCLTGPDGYGDGHLVDPEWSGRSRPTHMSDGWNGRSFDTFVTSSKKDWVYRPGDRILHTYAIYQRGASQDALLGDQEAPGWKRANAIREVHKPWGGYCRFLRAWATGHGVVEDPSLPLPFGDKKESVDVSYNGDDPDMRGLAKATTFPGVDGYRKIAVYTLAA